MRLARNVLAEPNGAARAQRLGSVDAQLYNAFLGAAQVDADALIARAPDELVVLRLDGWTVDLP